MNYDHLGAMSAVRAGLSLVTLVIAATPKRQAADLAKSVNLSETRRSVAAFDQTKKRPPTETRP